ncbi:lipoate--protein ligase [Sinomonas atrocyanea]|uniref:Lipoate--protein ligase n=1 Tax=Sinomonas atrocyanea TaxID=37927 RepID=A0A126ZUP1_9MICC|nr:hypothetical protein [Sinomonas atrocyanea]AMM30860.1 lipoate--protein ligase [Sinomonas atrocyanea]GEB64995.1 hypothetical protein SAT01_24430 [Sinomonas atrocyanea]GGG68858.1 hypothetical protein GCM10007172_21090 [Sinomonas atrocyanea]
MSVPGPFGTGPMILDYGMGRRSGDEDMELAASRLAALARGGHAGIDISIPQQTAAFGRLDSRLAGYGQARAALAERGYASVIRPVGGHLAVYGPGDLVVHLWAPHPVSRLHIRERFELFGHGTARALRALGIDARIGSVPGEYCSGEYSINEAGTSKLAGTGQRITKHGYLFSAVVMVEEAGPARAALQEAYGLLGLEFSPASVGCVADSAPGVTAEELGHLLAAELQHVLAPATGMLVSVPFHATGARR